MKAKLTNIKDKLVDALNELNEQHLLAIFGFFMLALVIGSMIIAPLSASAVGYFPQTVTLTNPNNISFGSAVVAYCEQSEQATYSTTFGTTLNCAFPARDDDNELITIKIQNGMIEGIALSENTIPDGTYVAVFVCIAEGANAVIVPYETPDAYGLALADSYLTMLYLDDNTNNTMVLQTSQATGIPLTYATCIKLVPTDSTNQPTQCPTLEEQIANYNGTWTDFLMMLRQNNRTLANSYQNNIDLAIQSGFQNGKEQGFNEGFSEGHLEGYTEGFNAGLNGGANRDPIDQYWNSTKDYILIAGQPYFAPNGFGSIDQYNTVGIYGEHESKLHRADGTTQTFNGQFVTQFASSGTLNGGWYKIGATVGDVNAYEQSLTPQAKDKAYYVSRVSPLGDPVEEFLVAIWVDGYESWYVAEEFVHFGSVANNNKSYKQVYSIYMTDISPTAQRFVNYDNPTLHETFNEDINATLYLATFNQLNNYNIYTDDIGIVESYNNGFDAGANTSLWTGLISQPIVAFFSIPLAQVIVEGVTYTLTYGIVLGAGIVALIVIWFLKLFAGG